MVPIMVLGGVACAPPVDDGQLGAWLAEAREADAGARALHEEVNERASWTLTLSGQVARPEVLPWETVDALADSEVLARPTVERPQDEPIRFRGVRLASLLVRAGAAPAAREVTIVASDGFRATFAAADVNAMPIQLSVTRDGEPISRSYGGPLFGTLPNVDFPGIESLYKQSWWAYYVTHVIVDTSDVALQIGERTVGAVDLAGLEMVTVQAPHGFRTGWDAGPVAVDGVRVRDVVKLAGLTLSPGDLLRVRVMASLPDDDQHALRLPAEALDRDDLVFGLTVGAAHEPIPARLGGPVVLLVPKDYAVDGASEWPTFVQGLTVERRP